ncbi:MAG: hypothetical protein LWX51_15660 [Deltaproteobacteria bacterium]|nr:hypothetical protein [Deltaproteobacteria bacterium]
MEWINDLRGKTVGLDTAPLIYFIVENPAYIEIVWFFFEAMDRGDFMVSHFNRDLPHWNLCYSGS